MKINLPALVISLLGFTGVGLSAGMIIRNKKVQQVEVQPAVDIKEKGMLSEYLWSFNGEKVCIALKERIKSKEKIDNKVCETKWSKNVSVDNNSIEFWVRGRKNKVKELSLNKTTDPKVWIEGFAKNKLSQMLGDNLNSQFQEKCKINESNGEWIEMGCQKLTMVKPQEQTRRPSR